MSPQLQEVELHSGSSLIPCAPSESQQCRWYAVFCLPQNEKSVVKHLDLRDVEAFLPTYEAVKVWKNRQRVRTILPLFPTYLFVHIHPSQRSKVLEAPGVIHIVGNGREHMAVSDATIAMLRSGVQQKNMEPYSELAVGKRVRIKTGSMEGLHGVLVRKGNGLRLVLALEMINQYAAVEIGADDVEQAED